MALNPTILGQALKTVTDAYNGLEPPADETEMETRRQNYWRDVAAEILNHLQSYGVIDTNVQTTGGSGKGVGTIS